MIGLAGDDVCANQQAFAQIEQTMTAMLPPAVDVAMYYADGGFFTFNPLRQNFEPIDRRFDE